ncbi:MAG: neutral zinc metallopeptidase [Tabrizicola sp.]|uniref:KPN_02809 family neutral zinc metallopeptidase n=1 Tax=Tabrizicola sp. TaxID=2005166 RepID=UPI0027326D8C|nr:neutral zinc metallopeptidase [Tabrizicola sp.]MDP3264428.1 neutral zinc metallopeptidase [Tabrizicola sp.]MDP3646474.1 neutral zinc metallopeptidase [Paracoccaceae bacterium]MDZ4069395.1 neutral zinc metallopeptidase [Tabrizicola sp.]
MEWKGRRGSNNIEDRRRMSGGRVGGVGVLAIVIIGYFLGVDLTPLLNDPGATGQGGATVELTAEDQAAGEFVSVTLADTEEVWTKVFQEQLGRAYRPATLVLFKQGTQSACGGASEATGPFYCPSDRKIYLDTSFFVTLERRLGAKGDFAAAYVVAHEIGHHVQNELGILGQANEVRQQVSEAESNEISVRVELQADCLSGIWAREAQQSLGTIERGDLEEAVNAARQIGDDTLQANAGQRPMPHTFTHGTSEQRSRWFVTGYQSGQLEDCDTFQTNTL